MRAKSFLRRYQRFWGADPARDVDDELAFHIEMRIDELVRAGWSEPAAREATMKRFGNYADVRDECEELGRERVAIRQRADRQDHVGHQGVDDGGEGRADGQADREVDEVAGEGEVAERNEQVAHGGLRGCTDGLGAAHPPTAGRRRGTSPCSAPAAQVEVAVVTAAVAARTAATDATASAFSSSPRRSR